MAKDGEPKRSKKHKKQQQQADEVRQASAPGDLPERLQQHHQYVTCGADVNLHASTVSSAHAYMSLDVDNSWSYDHFARNFDVSLNSVSDDGNDIEFDVKAQSQAATSVKVLPQGIDPAIMNAIRRIVISEVPTVAIEHVFFLNNTSIIPDEMLAHRLGLIPLNIEPRVLEVREADAPATERNTIVFKLKVECKRIDKETIENEKVGSRQFEYLPMGSEIPGETNCRFTENQQEALSLSGPVRPVHDDENSDILLAKLRPKQVIELEAHCTKGIGEEHAKWSPVATAWYRLNPEVVLLKDVTDERADKLMDTCPPKPKQLQNDGYEPLFRMEGSGNGRRLKVGKTRGNEHLLEQLRTMSGEEGWEDYLQVRKDKEHFIYTVQSTGVLPPEVLFMQAVDVLADKCDKLLENLP